MPSREPHDVTHAIWSSWQLQHEDYAAQDFLVYIDKRMDPVDPQLDFMIPWFELGGMKEDLDTVLRTDPTHTFDSLGDAYWQWAKNQAFEKTVTLGIDSSNSTVRHGDPMSWSEHGYLDSGSFEPYSRTWHGGVVNFGLEPLESKVFALSLEPMWEEEYDLTMTVNATDPGINFKFYIEMGGYLDHGMENVPQYFHQEEAGVPQPTPDCWLIVSNTNLTGYEMGISLVLVE